MELSVNSLERAGLVEMSVAGTASRPIDEVRTLGNRGLVGIGVMEEGCQRYDGTRRRRHDAEAVHQRSKRHQGLLEGDQPAHALYGGDVELDLD